jgi:arsenate reductase
MTNRLQNVLFLCTGNSARSILAESILNERGRGKFRAFSAGSHPTGQVNPYATEVLERNRMPTSGLRSKSWDEFSGPGAPQFDFIFTVCDSAAGEACPVWIGKPVTAHWGIEDPAAVPGADDDKRAAFTRAFTRLARRIDLFLMIPLDRLDAMAIKHELDSIGRSGESGQ